MSILKQLLDSAKQSQSLSPTVKQTNYGELHILVINHQTCTAAV